MSGFRLELKVPPVMLALLFACAMGFVAWICPWATVEIPQRIFLALGIWGIGLALIIAGAATFISAKTTVNPFTPELAISMVTSGIYRLSRNPMYVGILLMLAAWAVYLANILSASWLPLFVGYMNRFQITPEENALLAKFGGAYASYLKTVRRWM